MPGKAFNTLVLKKPNSKQIFCIDVVPVFFLFSDEKKFIENTFKDNPKVKVVSYQGLTTEFCKEIGVNFILRGLRNPADFEFEKAIAHTNRELSKVETVFLVLNRSGGSHGVLTGINSSI